MNPDRNGRTHEPDIRELAAEFDGFRETVDRLMEERDLRYTQISDAKDKAVQAALAAAEKAVLVAERNSEKWRDSANEWRAAMTDKDRNFVTKNALWGYLVGVMGLIPILVLLFRTFVK